MNAVRSTKRSNYIKRPTSYEKLYFLFVNAGDAR